jgi:hypothetical protein
MEQAPKQNNDETSVVSSIENPDQLDLEYQGLRRHFLEASRESVVETGEIRDREEIHSDQANAQHEIIEFGLRHPLFFNNIAHGPSFESFLQPILAASNRFSLRIQKTGDYYVPENGQTVYLIDENSEQEKYSFSISNPRYNPETKVNQVTFSIR